MFLLKKDNFSVSPDQRLLKADEYAQFMSAQEAIEVAKKRAEQIVNDAKQVYEEEKKRGYNNGMEEGNQKISEFMIDAVERSVKNFEAFENDMIGVVVNALRKILGEMNEKELVSRVVRNALETVRNQKKVNLTVNPDEVQVIKDQLSELLAQFPTINFIEVLSDPRITKGGCRLETEVGVVDATIDIQLAAIKRSLTRVVK